MGVITNVYEEESDSGSPVREPYNSECVIMMESVYDRLRPPPPVSGCGHRHSPPSSSPHPCAWDTEYTSGRSNSWPSGGGRRRIRRETSSHHQPCDHDCLHNCGQPAPDTGQEGGHIRASRREGCGRYFCAKCGYAGSWNKSRMLRVTRHCIVLLFLASCGGYILKSNIGKEPSDLADIVESPSLKDIRLEPVPISDLKRRLQNSKNYYDFFRIFISKKDVSDEVIDDFVNARTIQKIARDYEDELMMDEEEQSRLDEELTDAMYHTEEMATSPLGECKTPQPEIVKVIDEDNKNRMYLPECTVVHRCRNVSGCCGSSNLECGPLKLQVITRSFMVIDMFNNEKGVPGEDMVERRVFINHTECGCQEKRRPLPNCDEYKCPFPFTMMRHNVQCTCDCLRFTNEDNYLCQGIKDGIFPLTETDLACIKSGTCLKPNCSKGTLHVQTGHCPDVEEMYLSELQLGRNRIIKPRGNQKRELELRERELDEEEISEEAKSKIENEAEDITKVSRKEGKQLKPEEPLIKSPGREFVDLQVDHPVDRQPPGIVDLNNARDHKKSTHQSQPKAVFPPGFEPERVTEMSQSLQADSSVNTAVRIGTRVHKKRITNHEGNLNRFSETIKENDIYEKMFPSFEKDKTRRNHRKGRRFYKRQKNHHSGVQT